MAFTNERNEFQNLVLDETKIIVFENIIPAVSANMGGSMRYWYPT